MKTRRQFLCAAWLAACALFLLSACRGPTPIVGRVAETTATRGASNTPLLATPTASHNPTPESTATPTRPATDTATPTDTNTPTTAPTPPDSSVTATQEPDDAKPGRPTETPAVLNITPPEISGYTHSQQEDGTWVYRDGTGKEVAHIVTYNWEGLNWKKTIQRGALVVSDEKLMAYLLKTASEGRGKSEIPLFPLPFNPEGLELQEVNNMNNHTVIAIQGHIQQVVQPLPGSKMVLLNNYPDSSGIGIHPIDNVPLGFFIRSASFDSRLRPFYDSNEPFGAVLATNFSGILPPRYRLPRTNAVITAANSNGGLSVALDDFLSYGGYTVAVGK